MVGGSDQCCRIFRARFQVVQWRVAFEVFKHLFAVFACAVIACPVPADSEFMVAEHIHHTYLRDRYTEQVGTLCHAGTYQQTTVGTSYNGDFIFIRIFLVDQIFGSRDEIIEYVLFLHFSSGYVPVFTVFTTTAQVYLCVDTPIFEEWNAHGAEARVEADAEATVSVEEYRVFAVFLQIFLISKEHRNFYAVFAGEEYLFGHKIVRVELYFRGTI